MSAIDFSDPSTIAALAEALTAAGVDGIEISKSGANLRLVMSKAGGVDVTLTGSARADISVTPRVTVKAPMAGHFCPSHPSTPINAEHLPRNVCNQDVIGFIRIGSVLLPLSAGRSGLLTRQLAEPDALVGFGEPLFEIEPQS